MNDDGSVLSQQFLLAMYKEQCDQARQHEHLRQQSTALLVTLTSGAAVVESGLLSAALGQAGNSFLFLVVGSYSTIGLLVLFLAIHGRQLSLKHYERNRQHVQKGRAFRKILEKSHPPEYALKELRAEHKRGGDVGDRVFRLWADIYVFLGAIGVLLILVPIGLAIWLKVSPQA